MSWLQPASMATCFAIAIVAATTWHLYGRYRQRYMLIWSVAWTLSCLRYACMSVPLSAQPALPLAMSYYTLAVLHSVFNLAGCAHFLERPVPRWPAPTAVCILVWTAVAVPLRLPPAWQQVPAFMFAAAATIVTGYGFIRARRGVARGSSLTVAVGAALIVWGLHQGGYPFTYHIKWFAPIGFLLSAILALGTAVGILTLYFERIYDEAADRATALAGSEQRFRLLAETSSDMISRHALDGTYLYASPSCERLMGYRPNEVVGLNAFELIDPRDHDTVRQSLEQITAQPTANLTQFRARRPDGSVLWVESTSHCILDPVSGEPTEIHVSTRDISERRRVAEELAASEERFRLLAENCSDTISRHALDGTYLYVSPACERLMGYRPDELVGRHGGDFIHPDDHPAVLASLRTIMAGPEVALTQFRALRCDGSVVWVESTSHAILDPVSGAPTEVHASTRDITERRQAEAERERLSEQLGQARRMESVGRLAGGVAHDFNNMLQAILGNADLAIHHLTASSPVREFIEEIQRSARRSADLTRQLLGFARRQTIVPRVLDLNDSVEGTLRMLRRLIGEGTTLDWQPGPALWPVHMDPSQIDQLLVNLTVNARDAIHGIGSIGLATSNVVLDARHPVVGESCPPGRYVRLAVSDSGVGMDADTREHLFEPFFTTKGLGQGTGLGLATVFGIVTQNYGAVEVESALAEGSTFGIYLPAADSAAADPAPAAAPQPQGGTETLLLVEDEEQILRMAQQTLNQQGYTVLAASSPEEALALAAAQPGPIDLLVTDVIMPQMNGRQLADRLLAARPELRCLFISGYDADIVAQQGILPEQTELLAKPFSLDELAARVRHLLDQPADRGRQWGAPSHER